MQQAHVTGTWLADKLAVKKGAAYKFLQQMESEGLLTQSAGTSRGLAAYPTAHTATHRARIPGHLPAPD